MTTINYRTDDETSNLLRDQAVAEGMSMNALINKAVQEYLARHAHRDRVRALAAGEVTRWAELMERLK
ncbi:CopG family transcriptional regulator [Nocardia colli]|uniref:CopG family transcriptional regulator n=1 Tax=Nocardia colli TaxID=2545717 RepID=A0A5N0EDR6_9NOCA|nr:CopG family transcriptional regulator [Nocardia colli]KAA8886649.1 CopG family transcriptional regulator [Nocardia colli]